MSPTGEDETTQPGGDMQNALPAAFFLSASKAVSNVLKGFGFASVRVIHGALGFALQSKAVGL